MIGIFKSKNEKILSEVIAFEGRLNQALMPLLKESDKLIATKGALMAMAINIALYFLKIRNLQNYEEIFKHLTTHFSSVFGSVVEKISHGKISREIATSSFLREMQDTYEDYAVTLAKSVLNSEEALQGCLTIFLEKSGRVFTSEMERLQAVIILGFELQNLMKRFRSIL